MASLIPTIRPFLKLFPIRWPQSKQSKAFIHIFKFTYYTDTYIWSIYYNRQVMLTTREHRFKNLFWGPCLCISDLSSELSMLNRLTNSD